MDALDDFDARPARVVRRHREDKHADPYKDPYLVRRYDRRARGAWRHRRRDAKHRVDEEGASEGVEEDDAVLSSSPVPDTSDWEFVDFVPEPTPLIARLLGWMRG